MSYASALAKPPDTTGPAKDERRIAVADGASAGVNDASVAAAVQKETKNSKKQKKQRKPTLHTMSLGDLIALPKADHRKPPSKNVTKSTKPDLRMSASSRPFVPSAATASLMASSTDFPALSAVPSTHSSKPAAPPMTTKPQFIPEATKKKPLVPPPAAAKSNKKAKPATDKKKKPTAPPTMPADRDLSGEEHALMRLLQQSTTGTTVATKGRQRLKPRKKKFSALKKRVLDERLRRWQALHPPPATNAPTAAVVGYTLCLYGLVASPDEMEDDEEYDEIVADLRDMAAKVGSVQHVYIPRGDDDDPTTTTTNGIPAFVQFQSKDDAIAAQSCWSNLVIGGNTLQVRLLSGDFIDARETWKSWCLQAEKQPAPSSSDATPSTFQVLLDHVLTDDDVEDEECLEESLADIRRVAGDYGDLQSVTVDSEEPKSVVLEYHGNNANATQTAEQLRAVVLGGNRLSARLVRDTPQSTSIVLRNILSEDDLEDEDCLQESLDDVKELASEYGHVEEIAPDVSVEPVTVKVTFRGGREEARSAVQGLHGLIIGGSIVEASILNDSGNEEVLEDSLGVAAEKEPMKSGDKVIPERFAQSLSVPKIQGERQSPYYYLMKDEAVPSLLKQMLGELHRLQRRAAEDKNSKARRRLVMGLREVARGIRSHKIKMVVMANNLDDFGVIDERIEEILNLAKAESLPVFFEFNKRQLGKALGKSLKMAVVGIQSADGAHQEFKKLSQIFARESPSASIATE